MNQETASIDIEIYSRTTEIFEAKRRVFDPDAIRGLANDIVTRLAQARRNAPEFEDVDVCPNSISQFCDVLIQPRPAAALQFIEERRMEGASRQAVYIGYITEAARLLGERWQRGDLSFVDVTIGTGHLYALMRAMRDEATPNRHEFNARRHALFATVPGETHGIGITVAASVFRDAGWDIDLQKGLDEARLVSHVERTQPQIIGLSLSTDERLGELARIVVSLRLTAPRAIIGVALAGEMQAKDIRRVTDVDLHFSDARSACAELDRLIHLRA